MRLPRHPTERGSGRGRFDASAEAASYFASSGVFFSLCFLLFCAWLVGLILDFGNTTENALVGAMAAVTLLLVALIKNSELRAERAMQLKLDAIAAALLESRGEELSAKTRGEAGRRGEAARGAVMAGRSSEEGGGDRQHAWLNEIGNGNC
jgi:low affinity Fe/Cu permease